MPDWLETAKGWINKLTEVGLGLTPHALGLVIGILFGGDIVFFDQISDNLVALGLVIGILFGGDIVFFDQISDNLVALIDKLGQNGLVGLIALAIILWLFSKRNPG